MRYISLITQNRNITTYINNLQYHTSSLKANLKTCSRHRLSRVSNSFVVTASLISPTVAVWAAVLPSLRTLLYEHRNWMVSREGQLGALFSPRNTKSTNCWMLRFSRRSSHVLDLKTWRTFCRARSKSTRRRRGVMSVVTCVYVKNELGEDALG